VLCRLESNSNGAECSGTDPASDAGDAEESIVVTGSNITDRADSTCQPTPAAATAVDSDTSTMVIDSIPWGTGGTATAKGRSVPTQTSGGGGGSFMGGSTGGGSGRGGRPSDDSGGEEGGDRNVSAWQQWWVKVVLAGGGLGAVGMMSSTVREAFQNTVASIKSKFGPGESQRCLDCCWALMDMCEQFDAHKENYSKAHLCLILWPLALRIAAQSARVAVSTHECRFQSSQALLEGGFVV